MANGLSHPQSGRLFNDVTAYRPNPVPTPARLRRFMQSRALGVALLSSRAELPGRGPAPCKPLAGARITNSGEKGPVPTRRTANLLARADKQSMDSSAFIPAAKQDKQVSLSRNPPATAPDRPPEPVTTFGTVQILTLPTILTLLRVASIPVLMGGKQCHQQPVMLVIVRNCLSSETEFRNNLISSKTEFAPFCL